MAGVDRPSKGRILVDGKDVTGVTVRKRSMAMVYQQFINYPSLNVYKNIASPLKLDGIAKSEIDRRVRQTAEMLHIDNLLDRMPAELSGGQQQRTTIARASFTTGPDGKLYQLPDQQFANLYWFRYDWFKRPDFKKQFKEIYGYELGVTVDYDHLIQAWREGRVK